MRRRRLACLVPTLLVVGLYFCIPDRRAAVLKASVDRILDQAISEYLHIDVPYNVYDLQDSLICTSTNRCTTDDTSTIVTKLCTALVGKQVLFVGPETTYYLHTLWLDALQAHTNRSLMCNGPQFCTFHHVCGTARPTYNGRAVKFPNRGELVVTNSSIIRYVRSYTLHAIDDAKDGAYTMTTVDKFTGVRVHNGYWLGQARKADVIVLNHGPLPAPVSTYESENWVFVDQPVYIDGSPVVNAAVHATLTRFLPATVGALHVLQGLNSKKRPVVVWHGSWPMDAGCGDRKKRVMDDWLNSRAVGDPWTLYYNAQVYMQNRMMYGLMPYLGGVFYGLEMAERKEVGRGKFAAEYNKTAFVESVLCDGGDALPAVGAELDAAVPAGDDDEDIV
ncbi:hypothetical protein C0995_003679 [Termitomyces sp. Mi166|nr:hypothetical protein C0995_003679 [Termitomyces sp. Mi166\